MHVCVLPCQGTVQQRWAAEALQRLQWQYSALQRQWLHGPSLHGPPERGPRSLQQPSAAQPTYFPQ